MMEDEGPKFFEFNTSTLLKKALQVPPSHFKFKQTFVFLILFFWDATVPASIRNPRYQNPAEYVADLSKLPIIMARVFL